MSVKLLADHTTIIIAAGDAQRVGKFYGATVRAGGFGGKGGFPVGTTMSLIGVTNTLLGNWHGGIPLFRYDSDIYIRSRTQIRSDDSYKKIPVTQGG